MYGEAPSGEVAAINEGDIIDVKVDFDTNLIYYFNNNVEQGVIACTKNKLIEGELYPCVNLSLGTEVRFRYYPA